jgi:hypothetical protein
LEYLVNRAVFMVLLMSIEPAQHDMRNGSQYSKTGPRPARLIIQGRRTLM